MKPREITILGMSLDEWKHKSCIAHFGVGDNWATLYDITSKNRRKGHATELLLEAKKYYELKDKKVGGSVALNPQMKCLYMKCNIPEYE